MKINGRFSYDQSSQRDLEFYTDIRELDLGSRLYIGEESECENTFYIQTQREVLLSVKCQRDGNSKSISLSF